MRRSSIAAAVVAVFLALSLPAGATVTTSTRSIQYSPSSPTTTFAVTFPFHAADWLQVTKTTIATGAETVLVNGTDYTVTLPTNAAKTNGSITTTASVTNTHTLTIERVVPYTQTTAFRSQGEYRPRSLEDAVDKLTMISQQLAARVGSIDGGGVDAAVTAHEAESDPHTVYAKLAGRASGQTIYGGTAGSGANLTLNSNASSNGDIVLGTTSKFVLKESTGRIGIGVAAPSYPFQIYGNSYINSGGTGGGLLIQDGAILRVNDFSSTTYTSGTSDSSGARIRVHGSGHGSYPNDINIYATDLFVYSATGTLRATYDTNGLSIDGYRLLTDTIYGGTGSGDDLTIQSTTHATKGTLTLGSITNDEANSYVGINDTTPSVALDVTGAGRFTTTLNYKRNVIAGGAAYTIATPTECGSVVTTSTDNAIITLPATSSGCEVTVINTGADGAALVSVSPNAADGIFGSCVGVTGAGAATVVQFSGTDDKDINNTKATANKGDYVTLVGDGSAGWYVTACVGEWASSP